MTSEEEKDADHCCTTYMKILTVIVNETLGQSIETCRLRLTREKKKYAITYKFSIIYL